MKHKPTPKRHSVGAKRRLQKLAELLAQRELNQVKHWTVTREAARELDL